MTEEDGGLALVKSSRYYSYWNNSQPQLTWKRNAALDHMFKNIEFS